MAKLSVSILLLGMLSTFLASASDDLPLGVVLDSQGNPINLPQQEQSGLNYSSKEQQTNRVKPKHDKMLQRSQLASKKPSRKIKYSNKKSANDPSCRWLKARINKLESDLEVPGNQTRNGYHKAELTERNKEWRCMKCASQGPSRKDYDRCQFRR